MADHVPPERRRWMMSRVRSRDTAPEMRVRSQMHRAGYRYRLHVGDLPGKPDIVLSRYRTVIFVNGCFWHRHPGCPRASTPKTNSAFWERKFEANVARDKKVQALLRRDGWTVLVIWECQTQDSQTLADVLADTLPSPSSVLRSEHPKDDRNRSRVKQESCVRNGAGNLDINRVPTAQFE